MTNSNEIKVVEEFWDKNLCGTIFVNDDYLSREFFVNYTNFRYKKTHHLNHLINWKGAEGKDVLEIGLGIGADGTRWATYANSYTGIDLTKEAVEATKRHFSFKGLKGNIKQGNAEQLEFPDSTFDLVYSHGVLHHTPDINKTFREIHRVLNPEGEFILMVYAKNSFNYRVRILVYFRIRLIVELIKRKAGLTVNSFWTEHLENFDEIGWRYLSSDIFPHHCTDGPKCTIANIYSNIEVKKMLVNSGFDVKRMIKAHFPLGGHFPAFERLLGRLMGFHLLIWSKKSNDRT